MLLEVASLHSYWGASVYLWYTVCKKSVKQSGTLKLHLTAHNGECPFMCAMSKKSFNQPDSLKMHLHAHTGSW